MTHPSNSETLRRLVYRTEGGDAAHDDRVAQVHSRCSGHRVTVS
jgi:hypothetical protein